jgi:hypothetical protein
MALSPAMQKLVSQASNKYSRSSGSRIKPKEGVNRYRILVPDVNAQFWADLGVHWIKAEKNGKPLAVVGCDSIVHDTPCALCTAIEMAIASAVDEESKELYTDWKAKKSVLVNVLDRSKASDKPDEAQILELTPTTFGAILGIVQQYAEEGQDVLDAAEGIDISITKTGKGLSTEYAVNVAPGASKPVTKAHIASCHDLAAHIEKEFFRGDETKALNSIAQIAQISVKGLAAPSGKTPTAALTSRAAKVEDADEPATDDGVDEAAAAAEAEKKAAAAKKAAVAKAAAAKAAAAAAEAEAAAAAAAAEEDDDAVLSAMDDSDLDDVLKDLDDI